MERWALAFRLVGVGFYVGICIVLGVLVGQWLDAKFNTRFLVIVGLLLGILSAFTGVYQMLKPLMGKEDKEDS